MGTRGCTMVTYKGETKVAQYGQWDHYPSGQGLTILKFLRQFKKNYKPFTDKLEKVHFMGDEQEKELNDFLKSIGSSDGWLTMEQAEQYHKKYPLLTRDNGAGVLQMIMDTDSDKIYLQDSSNFATDDATWCEWAYVIDMDKMKVKIYDGNIRRKCVKELDLNHLPTEKQYLKSIKKLEE